MPPPSSLSVQALRIGTSQPLSPRPGLGQFGPVEVIRWALLLLIVANLGRLPLIAAAGKEAPLLFNDLLVLAVLLAAGIACLRRRALQIDVTAGFALAFAAAAGLSTLLAIPRFQLTLFEFFFSSAYLIRWLVYFGLYLAVINVVRREQAESVWKALEWMVIGFAAFGIVQAIALPGFAQIVYPDSEAYLDWDPQGHRLVSTFLDPNFAGGLIVLVLLVLAARMAFGAPVPHWKLFLLTAAVVMTLSRSSWLALIAGGMVIASVRGHSRRLIGFAGAGLLAMVAALPWIVQFATSFNKLSLDASALVRVVSWMRALEIFSDHPIIGVGFNTYGFVRERYGFVVPGQSAFGVDGGLLFIAVLTGVVGLALYCGILYTVLRRCRRIWQDADRDPRERGFALGVAAVTVAIVVHSIFLNSILYPFLMQPLWVLWGLTFVLLPVPGEGEDDRAPAPERIAPALVALPEAPRT
jgi:O-antigen ligase